jgi:acyl carrier protein/1-acyl-sn-glycerol-3-phosphate acyltransferase
VYVCSNGEQRLAVDKALMEGQRLISVMHSDKKEVQKKLAGGEAKKDVVVLMGCGRPSSSDQLDLRIVDTESSIALEEDRVGEIWLHSPSAAAGYWGMEERSRADFGAVLSGASDEQNGRRYLRTGDLGFLHNGELFVCGRLKDLIIIRGRNHYPQDIERTCESVRGPNGVGLGLRKGCSAAFSVSVAGQEMAVYVAELNDGCALGTYSSSDGDAILESIRVEVQTSHGISLSTVCLLPPRTIQKTSSGKIARQLVRRAYLEGSLKAQLSWSDLDASSAGSGFEFVTMPRCSDKAIESTAEGDERMDPTGQPLTIVLDRLTQAVAQCLHRDAAHISTSAPLASLGMDSMQSIALQSVLDASFTISLPDELMFEMDATLSTLAECLVNGGSFRYRPIMLLGSDLHEAARKIEISKPYNKTFLGKWFGVDASGGGQGGRMSAMLSPQWIREHQVKAHVDTLSFPDGCALEEVPLRPLDDPFAVLYSFLFFGVFMWLPVCIALVFMLLSFKIAAAIFSTFLVIVYTAPFDCYPACFRTGWALGLVNRYYSYRMIIEAPRESYTSVPSIYSFGPHGVFSISPAIQSLLNEFALGENMHFLAASAALWVPVYNVYLRMMGFRSVDRKPFKDTLLSGRSVGIIPGGIAEMFSTNADTEIMMVQERKGFIAIALETGAQIVPCYCFGNTQTFFCGSNRYLEYLSRVFRMSLILFWGRFGLPVPFRTAQITVIGRPLLLPKVVHPTPELINDYHEQYLRETRRLYDKYKNTYNWQQRKLVFKR